jgi:hypothetical protein
MTKEEAKIVLLEQELVQAYHTISFLHNCLTHKASYGYPEQTLKRLEDIKELVNIPKGCAHGGPTLGCKSCTDSLVRWRVRKEAQEVLGIHKEQGEW